MGGPIFHQVEEERLSCYFALPWFHWRSDWFPLSSFSIFVLVSIVQYCFFMIRVIVLLLFCFPMLFFVTWVAELWGFNIWVSLKNQDFIFCTFFLIDTLGMIAFYHQAESSIRFWCSCGLKILPFKRNPHFILSTW